LSISNQHISSFELLLETIFKAKYCMHRQIWVCLSARLPRILIHTSTQPFLRQDVETDIDGSSKMLGLGDKSSRFPSLEYWIPTNCSCCRLNLLCLSSLASSHQNTPCGRHERQSFRRSRMMLGLID
jgi:hypothetical protein